MQFRWSLATPQPLLASKLAAELRIDSFLIQCLLNRGVSEPAAIAAFLEPRLKQLSDPFLLPGMSQAVDRLFLAHSRGERVVIFGDYDVDGVSSTALLLEVLQALGWGVDAYLPHRFDEGYGLSRDGVENCLRRFSATLILAVDCGSSASETVGWLQSQGIDAIILDHHQIGDPPPKPVALVNPQVNAGDPLELKTLCSVGLSFKLAHALVKRGRQQALPAALDFDVRTLLDLVALGTIADLVPLRGENRVLVSAGLQRLNATDRPGLIALNAVAQTSHPIGVFEIGFQLAPRLNAAGRLETAAAALDLLRARDLSEAEPLAGELDGRNRERQKIERSIVDEVTAGLRARFDPERDYAIIEGGVCWHIGVVGIVAARVLREFYRPTIILGGEGPEWRGSGRSIDGFNLAAALRECSDLLVRHGGHAMAAGLTIRADQLEAFRVRFNELARRGLTSELLQPVLRLDLEVPLPALTTDFVSALDRLEPVGQGNAPVHFMCRDLWQARPGQPIGRDQQHMKLWVTDGRAVHETVWWNCAGKPMPGDKFDLAFAPKINEFNGRRTVQLKLLDWRPAVCA